MLLPDFEAPAIRLFLFERVTKGTHMNFRNTISAALVATLALSIHGTAQQPARHTVDLTVNKPESVGFSSERLERLHALIQGEVDQKQLAGAVTILARHGKVVEYRTYGVRDIATASPVTKDTIFRAYSMTKPVTGVAMMILYEQGKWLPSDPISKFIPEFAHLKVFKGVDAEGKMILVDPDHAPTMRELMSHTAGFTYGSMGNTVVDQMVRDAKVMQSENLQEMIDKLAKLPLLYQPGKGWTYSLSMDIQGYIVEKLSGKPLPEFMRDNIFTPLGMKDTGFYVPAEKRNRFATNYKGTPDGGITPTAADGGAPADYAKEPTMPSGGGGLVTTIEDYYRFASMLANGGEPCAGFDSHRGVWHRPVCDAAGLWLWLRLRRDLRSAGGEPLRRQRDFLLGWRGGNVVLGRPHKRYCLCEHDSAYEQSRQPQL
jgi:CubicO group peptidase (beta-lactamase class C family)